MLLRAERIGEQRKAKYTKVIEHIGGYYEAQEVPLGGPARAQSEPDQIEANGRLGELFEDLGLPLPNDGADQDGRRELYAVVASICA